MPDIDTLKTDLATANRILANEGLVDAWGHLSARIPGTDTFLIPPRMSPALVQPEDLLTFDLEGRKLHGDKIHTSETPLHTRIYRARPDVGAVSHTHSPMALILGISGQALRPLHNTGVIFHDGVPVLQRPGLIDTDELGDLLAETLGQHKAVLMRGHGATIVGPTLKETLIRSILLEEAARNQVWASAIGTPLFFSEEEMDLVGRDFFAKAGGQTQLDRAWNYYVDRLPPS
jgi:HCOMODA/2-hydroxy-3-carboxy-muconic semialdehyde decarboxylase